MVRFVNDGSIRMVGKKAVRVFFDTVQRIHFFQVDVWQFSIQIPA